MIHELAHPPVSLWKELGDRLAPYRNQVVVYKWGGSVEDMQPFARDIATLHRLGINTVIVHGGGKEIERQLQTEGIQPREKVQGQRPTSAEELRVVKKALSKTVNPALVKALRSAGVEAFGLFGDEDQLILARQKDPELEFVGDVREINSGVLRDYLSSRIVPVISPLGFDDDRQSYNINADTVAGSMAYELRARRTVFLSDVPGIMLGMNSDAPRRLESIESVDLPTLLFSDQISGGMIPKVLALEEAVKGGTEASILDGRFPNAAISGTITRGVGEVGTVIYG